MNNRFFPVAVLFAAAMLLMAGSAGAITVTAHNESSGNTYDLDADVEGNEVERLYFPNGGSVGFSCSEIDTDGNGSGMDEQGREWTFEGIEGGSSIASSEDSYMDE